MSMPNSSSSAMTSSTMSSESAPRSSMNLASGANCLVSTSSSLAMISLTRSSLKAPTRFTSCGWDRPARQLAGQRPRQADESGLGGGVIGLTGVAHQPNHRRDVDDAARARLHHGARHGTRAAERAGEVGVEHLVPLLVAHAHEDAV